MTDNNTLTLTAEMAAQYAATLERFQDELITRYKASASEAHQALYLMLIQGPAPYGHLRIVLGAHAPAVAHIAERAGMSVLPVRADGQTGIALPPMTGDVRAAWSGPVMF